MAKKQQVASDFRQIIDDERKRLGLSQAELAARAGTYQANVSEYLCGKSDINTDTLKRLLAALGLELEVRAGK